MVRAARDAGFTDISVVTHIERHKELIEAEGVRVIPLAMERRSLNPFKALGVINRLGKHYASVKPDLIHHIAMKPVLFGSIAAWLAGAPRVLNNFAGLGYLFCGQGLKPKLLKFGLLPLFRFFLKRRGFWLLVQNSDDRDVLAAHHLVPKGRTQIIKGSGVDMDAYAMQDLPPANPDVICTFAGRMIEIKGLPTLKEAFALLKARAPHIKLWLCGAPDAANPGAWTEARLQEWGQEPNVTYKGRCENMQQIWAQSHIAVQPSYGGEGVPKSLLEAAAIGRAIVTTRSPGCRDLVTDGVNGYVVPVRDAAALAAAIERCAEDMQQCAKMGRAGRALVEKEFSAPVVSAQTEALYRRILAES